MKALLALLVIGALGYVAYAKVLRSPARACDRIASLCDVKASDDDHAQCTDMFDSLAKNSPDDKTASCVLDAKTCAEAVGCTAGGAMKLAGTAASQFMNGFSKATK